MTEVKKIAVLPGDGIGPEVITQAIKVLEAVGERFNRQFVYRPADVGATAIDKTGDPLPQETIDVCLEADAVLFGAIGHPKYDNDPNAKVRPEQGLLKLRKTLGLYANIRPVTAYAPLLHLSPLKEDRLSGADLLILRELTGGIYFGEKGRTPDGAYDHCTYTVHEIERITRLAFNYALQRRQRVTLVDKANVLETSRLWREVVKRIADAEFPQVVLDWMFVDNAAMQMIINPAQFDVILTENMFGDIISDEASVIAGSLGMLPSASIGEHTALFEPIHGSYPQAAGEDIANPIATILSAAMMLESFSWHEEANAVRQAVGYLLAKGIGTPDLRLPIVHSCSHIGDMLAHLITEPDAVFLREEKIHLRMSTII